MRKPYLFNRFEEVLSRSNAFSYILLIALLLRLFASFGVHGYVGFDSQWLVIENAQKWANGEAINGVHTGHHFFYPLVHSVIFYALQGLGIFDPMTKMLVVRLVHAIYSLLTVVIGYKIALLLLSDQREEYRYLVSNKVALLLAAFWFFPFNEILSYIEMVCIPPMMLGIYYLLQVEKYKYSDKKLSYPLLARVILGIFWLMIATMLRYQIAIFVIVAGLFLLYWRQYTALFVAVLTGILSLFFFFALPDKIVLHQYLFYSLHKYIEQNLMNMGGYVSGDWFSYLSLILGVLIPPISFLIVGGAFRSWKSSRFLAFSLLTFFLFHSFLSNRQERFIFPMIPLLIILGTVGYQIHWKDWLVRKIPTIYKASWIFFIVLNTVLLIITSTTYYKKSNVETAYFFSQKQDVEGIAYDSAIANVDLLFHLPFYMQKNHPVPFWQMKSMDYNGFPKNFFYDTSHKYPNYVVFVENKNLQDRVAKFSSYFSVKLSFKKRVEPSWIDKLLHNLNHYNKNLTTNIYSVSRLNN